MFKKTLLTGIFLFVSLLVGSCEKDNNEKWETKYPGEKEEVEFSQYGEPFTKVPEISDIAMYEVNIRAFSQEGNLNGITVELDSLKKLGVNVVWLMPIYPSGKEKSVGSPYAVKDYMAIHEDYGTLEDLRVLVSEAHQRDMAVILDWVANHTAWDHNWITEHPSWYSKDEAGQIIIPPGTGWEDVAELNYEKEAMRLEMIRAMKYWVLEANVDGFRCDYAHGVPDDFWKQAIDTLRSIPERDIIMFAESDRKELLSAGFDMIFGWKFYDALKEVFSDGKSASVILNAHKSEYAGLSNGKHVLRWTSNHDQNAWETTPIDQFNGKKGAMAAFVAAAYLGGVPLVYSGQEVACPEQLSFFEGDVTKIDWTIDPDYKLKYEQILHLRASYSALRNGKLTYFSSDDVLAFERSAEQNAVLVFVNVRNEALQFPLPESLQNTTWVDAFSGEEAFLGISKELPAYGYVVFSNP
ncbi:alpha-amylase family glycosyl hydrolase [Thermophagus sp. OGC60D27]|uniref:alpha-amylase family glycosyl hydrolase n=1 Tax=Thermophagus sp. OGC60D27 TaxID=3458415 RepID=UPI004037D347